jgi:hypothetical protein
MKKGVLDLGFRRGDGLEDFLPTQQNSEKGRSQYENAKNAFDLHLFSLLIWSCLCSARFCVM